MAIPDYKMFHPLSRKAWRQWLAQYHDCEPGVWFVYYKKGSGKPRVSYDDAVEEALCFGWIPEGLMKKDPC